MSADGAVRAHGRRAQDRRLGRVQPRDSGQSADRLGFKPFVYAAALELGYSPYDTVIDEPFCMNIAGSGRVVPQELHAQSISGRVTLAEALKRSLNIPAVKVSEAVGPRSRGARSPTDFGIDSDVADTSVRGAREHPKPRCWR